MHADGVWNSRWCYRKGSMQRLKEFWSHVCGSVEKSAIVGGEAPHWSWKVSVCCGPWLWLWTKTPVRWFFSKWLGIFIDYHLQGIPITHPSSCGFLGSLRKPHGQVIRAPPSTSSSKEMCPFLSMAPWRRGDFTIQISVGRFPGRCRGFFMADPHPILGENLHLSVIFFDMFPFFLCRCV